MFGKFKLATIAGLLLAVYLPAFGQNPVSSQDALTTIEEDDVLYIVDDAGAYDGKADFSLVRSEALAQYHGANLQTGTTYELVLADAGKVVELANGSPITLTIPANASVAFPVNTVVYVVQGGTGGVTINITSDTLNGSTSISSQYSSITLWKRATTEWVGIDSGGGGGGLANVVEDTTPQLGGNLDVNGNDVTSTSNGNIILDPNGTGNIEIGNFEFDGDQTVGAGQDDYVLTYDNAAGIIALEASAGGAGSVPETLFDANTILKADTDDTPAALVVPEQSLVGRITAGSIDALTVSEAQTLLNVEDGADVTDATNVDAAGAVMESDFTTTFSILARQGGSSISAQNISTNSIIGRQSGGFTEIAFAADQILGRDGSSDINALSTATVLSMLGLDTALHDDVSGEIAGLTEKSTPVSADLLLIEDSAASNAKKKLQIGNLPDPALTPAPSSDHAVSGITAEMQVGESVVFGQVLFMHTDGKLWEADADVEAEKCFALVADASISADATGTVLLSGFARDDTWAWTVGGSIYNSTTVGALTQTAPSGTGDRVQVCGTATHADRIFFNPDSTWIIVN